MSFEADTEWVTCSLGDVVTLQRGFDLPKSKRRDGSVPIVSSSGVTGAHDEARVAAPGVVTGRYGTLGQVFLVQEDFWPLNTTLWVKEFNGNDPAYVAELLRTINFLAYSDKTSVPGVNRNHLHKAIVRLPPLVEQRRIAGVLGALEAKRSANLTLADQLLRLSASISQHQAVSQASETVQLDKIVSLYRVKASDQADPYIGLDQMPRGSALLADWRTKDAPTGQSYEFAKGDLLFGKLRPNFKKAGVALIDGRASGEALVLRPDDTKYFGSALATMLDDGFFRHCVAMSTGTRMPRCEWRDAGGYEVRIPVEEMSLRAVSELARAAVEFAASLVTQARSVAALRDVLRPDLVRGARRVADDYTPDATLAFAG